MAPGARRVLLVLALAAVLAGCAGTGQDGDPGAGAGPDDGAGNGTDGGAGPVPLPNFTLVEVASGFENPLHVTHAGDGSGRLFVVEQGGTIHVVDDGAVLDEPFLDIGQRVSDQGFEQGLLGLAFPPDHEVTGRFYLAYTDIKGDSVLARYHVDPSDPNRGLAESEEILLEQQQPFANHNGGHLAFGPDGYLWHGLGDGGGAGDPQQQAQNTGTLLGSLLRVDVSTATGYDVPDSNPFTDQADARDEIWAYGLRNPWRFSFDAGTDDLYIADVGQSEWEEVNVQPPASDGGENYGWNIYEGDEKYPAGPPESQAPNAVFPVATYGIQDEDCAVTGGFVYRGDDLPDLQGRYVMGDYCSGRLRVLEETDEGWTMEVWRETDMAVTSFGTDADGELYVVDHEGAVYRFAAAEDG